MTPLIKWVSQNKGRFALAILLLSLILRVSALYHPFLDVDESQFAGFAHTLMDGGLPYKDSLDTKPPFIYLFYWLCFALFGKYSMLGVHLAGIAVAVAVALALARAAAEAGRETAGRWAALFYAVFSTAYLPKFISVSITSVMVLPLALSALYWMKGERDCRKRWDLAAGLLCGIAFLFKYQGGIQIAVFFAVLAWGVLSGGHGRLKAAMTRYAVLIAGFVTPIALTAAALAALGVWHDFARWSLEGSAHYIGAGNDTIPFVRNLLVRGGSFALSSLLLWVLLGAFIAKRPRPFTPLERLALAWLALSAIPVATGGRFYGHYFLQILPPLCLIAGMAMERVDLKRWLKPTVALLVAPALFFWMLRLDQKTIYELFPDDGLHEQEVIGKWLKENTRPEETLFVWGFATAIYFHAERRAASRFLWTDLLTGKVPGSRLANDPDFDTARFARPEAWKALWEDFASNPPDYFIDTAPANIHDYGKYPIHRYAELDRHLTEHYAFYRNVGGCMIYRRKGLR